VRPDIRFTERAVLRRPQTDGVRHARASQRGLCHAEFAAIDPLATNKGIVVGNGHGIHVAGVHVIDVANVRVEDIPVANERVVNVDPLLETAAATEPWEVRFAVAEWEPADSSTESATEKAHESRPVDRSSVDRPRAPAPPAADVGPAAVVVGSKAPG